MDLSNSSRAFFFLLVLTLYLRVKSSFFFLTHSLLLPSPVNGLMGGPIRQSDSLVRWKDHRLVSSKVGVVALGTAHTHANVSEDLGRAGNKKLIVGLPRRPSFAGRACIPT